MEYKISEVVAKTGIPKSTILYYIKEGLLPQAKKLKSNVHSYNDEHIELLKYIRYMKDELGSTNEQIKFSLTNKNNSFSSSYTMLTPLMQTLSGIAPDAKYFSKEEFIEHYDIDKELLAKLLREGIIMPLQDKYTQKEASIIHLVEMFLEEHTEYTILKEYLEHAKKLAELEYKMQITLCSLKKEDNFSRLWKIMFETLFTAKDYIFKRSTYTIFHKALKDEMKL
ncbi:MerR family transcriptional regulator [Sulfurimonas sp.]|uniref:MerR family transcriptional regulator n=1 Tax=Sulfurimonas sp. TaxID=2022749 RepID=UPI002622250F|nr:MerR family transcriptional regulator [Sulfurimonas sp.]